MKTDIGHTHTNYYKAPLYYTTTMKDSNGNKIPIIKVCIECGKIITY